MQVTKATAAPYLRTPALLWMALACGLCAGGNYFNQPLLHSIAQHFAVGEGVAAMSVTLAQSAYALGLLLLVPLGDMLERRSLAMVLMLLAATGQALAGWATQVEVFMLGTLMAGVFSVAAQVLVPMAAALAAPGRSGRNVGTVMTGLLLGILLARSVAGMVSAWGGWQLVYQGSAVLMVLLACVLRQVLPASQNPQATRYGAVLSSMLHLLKTHAVLRQRTWVSALAFASVSVLFATMALQLAAEPLSLNDAEIGWVGLSAAAGALVASQAGRWVDRGWGRTTCAVGALAMLLAWPMLWWGGAALTWFVLGLVVIDLGLQCINITNQASVAQLLPAARSRMNAVYMTGYFAGAASGSAMGSLAWYLGGWSAACALGMVLAMVAAWGTVRLRRAVAPLPAGV